MHDVKYFDEVTKLAKFVNGQQGEEFRTLMDRLLQEIQALQYKLTTQMRKECFL